MQNIFTKVQLLSISTDTSLIQDIMIILLNYFDAFLSGLQAPTDYTTWQLLWYFPLIFIFWLKNL